MGMKGLGYPGRCFTCSSAGTYSLGKLGMKLIMLCFE
jgi:hypothetical protein